MTVPSRRQVLDYLDASYSYFQSVGCKEGMNACSEAVSHAFHEPPAPPPVQDQLTQLVQVISDQVKHQQTAPASSAESPPADKQ